MKKLIFLLALLFLVVWPGMAVGEGKVLTSSAARPQAYDADGSLLVWSDERLGYDGNLDIYVYNLRTGKETSVIADKGGQFGPRISGNKIVWFDYRHKNADVFVKDLKTGKQWSLTLDKGDQLYPDIERDWVVWLDKGAGGDNVYLYSLCSGNIFDISSGQTTQPAIEPANSFAFNGRQIVWDQNRTGNLEIYFCDLGTKKEWRITSHPARQSFPDLSGTKIIWLDNRNNQADIFVYDLKDKKERFLVTDNGEKKELRLWGDRVLWLEFPPGSDKLRGSKGIFYKMIY